MTIHPPKIKTSSIKRRLMLASFVVLPIICGLLGWSLDRAHTSSLIKNTERQLKLHAYALMASAELEENHLWLPPLMTEDRFNQTSSELVAFILADQNPIPIWSSLSLSGKHILKHWKPKDIDIGDYSFGVFDNDTESFFYFHYNVAWESAQGDALPYHFIIMESQEAYSAQVEAYRKTLWLWLSGIALLLITTQTLILNWGLNLLNHITDDLNAVQQGHANSLNGQYPKELTGVAKAINQLIEHEHKQRARYRNTLSDLAHSIKNPVSIISGALEQLKHTPNAESLHDIEEQNQRINQIITYQLSRAVGQSSAPFRKQIPVENTFLDIKNALDKVYIDKAMDLELSIEHACTFRGDKGDLMELLGNLLDNAYKYGKTRIKADLKTRNNKLWLSLEDDGPGISESDQELILRRGKRADTSQAGQGIGLAVVEDIVQNYDGSLELGASNLGGLKITVLI